MATLDRWLGENVETDENRDRVRSAASGLGDLRAWDDGRYDYVAANAVRSVPSGALARLGRIFGK